MGGNSAPKSFQGGLPDYKLGNENDPLLTVEVNNVLIDTKIYNVFGVIKGFIDAGEFQSCIALCVNARHCIHPWTR